MILRLHPAAPEINRDPIYPGMPFVWQGGNSRGGEGVSGVSAGAGVSGSSADATP
jgi:hypothetical protein